MAKTAAVRGGGKLAVVECVRKDIKPHPRNYREHPDDQLAHIAASIKANGFYRPLLLANDGATLLAGHGVLKAITTLMPRRFRTVPCVILPCSPDSPAAMKVLTGDNEISNSADIDDRLLSEILRDISKVDNLLGSGFDEAQLANLLMVTRPSSEVADFDAAAEWAGMPEYENAPTQYQTVLYHRTEEEREEILSKLGLRHEDFSKRAGHSHTFWYPVKPDDAPRQNSNAGYSEAEDLPDA